MNKPQTQFYTLCVIFNLILLTILGARVFGDDNATTETKIGAGQLFAILNSPSIQKELGLDDDQIAAIAKINVNPIPTTFADAMLPLNTILLEEQLKEFKRIAFQGLMVRAFTIAEVQESLNLTPDQKNAIAAIQSNFKTKLQPAQDRIRRGENGNPFDEERDTKVLHEKAYLEALELLTAEQKEKWAEIARPVPLLNEAHRNADDGWYRFPVSLQGNWKIENALCADSPLEPYIGQAVSIDGDSIVLRTDSASNVYHISHVEPGESQIEIDLTAKRAGQSRTFRCLLAVTLDRLTLVRPQNCEHPRPRSLSNPERSETVFTIVRDGGKTMSKQ